MLLAGGDVLNKSGGTCSNVAVNHAGHFWYTCYDKTGAATTDDTYSDGVTMTGTTAAWLGVGLGLLALVLAALPWSLYPVLIPAALVLRSARTRRLRRMTGESRTR